MTEAVRTFGTLDSITESAVTKALVAVAKGIDPRTPWVAATISKERELQYRRDGLSASMDGRLADAMASAEGRKASLAQENITIEKALGEAIARKTRKIKRLTPLVDKARKELDDFVEARKNLVVRYAIALGRQPLGLDDDERMHRAFVEAGTELTTRELEEIANRLDACADTPEGSNLGVEDMLALVEQNLRNGLGRMEGELNRERMSVSRCQRTLNQMPAALRKAQEGIDHRVDLLRDGLKAEADTVLTPLIKAVKGRHDEVTRFLGKAAPEEKQRVWNEGRARGPQRIPLRTAPETAVGAMAPGLDKPF